MQRTQRPRQGANQGTRLVFSAILFTLVCGLPQLCCGALAKGDVLSPSAKASLQVAETVPAVSSTSSSKVGSESDSAVQAALSETARNYESAFRKGDAAALAQLWAENGKYVDGDGNSYNGRAEIERTFQDYFKQSGSAKNIEIAIESVKPIGSNGALETGVARVKDDSGKLLSTAAYSVIHVNNDGKWQMASVSEARPQYFDNLLEKLRWMSGEWSANGAGGEATLSTRWQANQHLLVATYRVKTKTGETHEDMQIIGVDPGSRRIVSWLFDSEGGVGRGVWSTNGKTWAVDQIRTSADGRRVRSRSLLQPRGSDTFVWKSTGRSLNGLLIPDSDTITVNRIHL